MEAVYPCLKHQQALKEKRTHRITTQIWINNQRKIRYQSQLKHLQSNQTTVRKILEKMKFLNKLALQTMRKVKLILESLKTLRLRRLQKKVAKRGKAIGKAMTNNIIQRNIYLHCPMKSINLIKAEPKMNEIMERDLNKF